MNSISNKQNLHVQLLILLFMKWKKQLDLSTIYIKFILRFEIFEKKCRFTKEPILFNYD